MDLLEKVAIEWLDDSDQPRFGIAEVMKIQSASGDPLTESKAESDRLTIWWYDNPKTGAVGHPRGSALSSRQYVRQCSGGHKWTAACKKAVGHEPKSEVKLRSAIKVTSLKLTSSGRLCSQSDGGHPSSLEQCQTSFIEFTAKPSKKAKGKRKARA